MLCLAGNFVSDGTVSSIINLIITANQLHVYSVHKLFFALKNNMTQEGLVKVSLYAFGEFGDLLVSNPAIGSDNETIIVTENDLLNLINEIMNRKYENQSTTVFLLNCLIKLSVRLGDIHIDKIKEMLEKENSSFYSEVQQRASEYLFFLQPRLNELRHKVLEGIPLSKIIKEIEINKYLNVILERLLLKNSKMNIMKYNLIFIKILLNQHLQ
jgi:AP-1 complex subunit gamma-1